MALARVSAFRTLAFASMLFGCTTLPLEGPSVSGPIDRPVAQAASAAPLVPASGRLITDNDEAFLSKLELIEQARESLDLVYYIWAEDYSSSRLSQALIDAAKRGVRVRLLLDYATNYKRLDLFSLLEREGAGRLEVRLYGRPTRNIVMDAAFMTAGCGGAGGERANCGADKLARIEQFFAGEAIGGVPAERLDITNRNTGGSGVFLSGLYAKRPDVTAVATQAGQGIDPKDFETAGPADAGQRERMQRLGRAYWDARFGRGFDRLEGRLTMFYAMAAYGEQLAPVEDTLSAMLPLDKKLGEAERRDWEHFSDFTHHKLLLADGRRLQMGGRNVEDAYHMRPNPLTRKYVFMDTDLAVDLAEGGERVRAAFDGLWDFQRMVARLAEVRAHAPNDVTANQQALEKAQQACRGKTRAKQPECLRGEFAARARGLAQRMELEREDMLRKARTYESRYRPSASRSAGLPLDAGAALAYLENLHFDKSLPPAERQRIFGAQPGRAAASGKHIHETWYRALETVCERGGAQRVVIHNAYFFPPAEYMARLATLFDGSRDCGAVTVTVLTNSIETTDLNVVNILARHSMKAFLEHLDRAAAGARAAKLDYREYRAPGEGRPASLHTKVTVLGEDLVVGSANADVRSLMMDTNNAMLIRSAPQLRARYLESVDALLRDAARTADALPALRKATRELMLREDLASFDALLAKYRVDKRLDDAQEAKLRTRFREMLDAAYRLTAESLDPAASASARRAAQQRFDDTFKPI